MRTLNIALIALGLVLSGCPSGECTGEACVGTDAGEQTDAGRPLVDAGTGDAGGSDAGTMHDAGGSDAGVDAGEEMDGGEALDAGALIPGDTCDLAQVLGLSVYSDTTALAHDNLPGCMPAGDAPGPELVYRVTVPPNERLLARVVPPTMASSTILFDPSIYLIEAANMCRPGPNGLLDCAAFADNASFNAPEQVTYVNHGSTPKDVFVVIDSPIAADDWLTGVSKGGPFSLEVSFGPAPAGDDCATATTLLPGNTATAQSLFGFSDDVADSNSVCAALAPAPDRVYSVPVPAGQQLVITMGGFSQQQAWTRASIFHSLASCGAGSTCASTQEFFAMSSQAARWVNTSSATVNALVVVEASNPLLQFNITAAVRAPLPDDTCANPTPLTPGPTTMGTLVGYSNDFETPRAVGGSCFGYSRGADRMYSLSVPPGQRGTLTVTPRPVSGRPMDPGLHLVAPTVAACTAMPLVCAVSSDVNYEGQSESVRYSNPDSVARPLYAIVDSTSPETGDYDISLQNAVPPADDTCLSASTVLHPGVGLTNKSLAGFEQDYPSGIDCMPTWGPDRVFAVHLDAGQQIDITVTPDAGSPLDLVLNLVSSPALCDSLQRRCAAASADTEQIEGPDSVSYVNDSSGPQRLMLIVSTGIDDASAHAEPFDLAAVVSTPAPGDICSSAMPASLGQMAGQTLAGMEKHYSFDVATCREAEGPERVYTLTVPANRTLVATATPLGIDAPAVNIVDGSAGSNCGRHMVCLAGSVGSTPATAEYENTSGVDKPVFIIVSASDSSTATPLQFSLGLSVH